MFNKNNIDVLNSNMFNFYGICNTFPIKIVAVFLRLCVLRSTRWLINIHPVVLASLQGARIKRSRRFLPFGGKNTYYSDRIMRSLLVLDLLPWRFSSSAMQQSDSAIQIRPPAMKVIWKLHLWPSSYSVLFAYVKKTFNFDRKHFLMRQYK